MLDAVEQPKAAAAPSRPAPAPTEPRKGPIKVKVSEPALPAKGPLQGAPHAPEALPEDVAALLDAFSEPGEAATRAASVPAAPPVAHEEPLDLPVAGEEALPLAGDDPLDLPVAAPAFEVQPDSDTTTRADEPESLLDSMMAPEDDALGLLHDLQRLGAPPQAAPTAAASAAEPRTDDVAWSYDVPVPASRTATKFKATAPRANEPESGGLDLGALADAAFAEGEAARPAPRPNPPAAASSAAAKAVPAPAGDARAPRAPGQETYGPYQLLEKIAVGGMAELFRAKRTGVEGFEKVVAVKRILPHLSDNKEFVDMFINEAKMVAGLTHPNIVQIFDLGRIEKSYYIAMEYVHGRDLRSILRQSVERALPLPRELAVLIASKVAAALDYAHRKKDDQGQKMRIVHRDVSPQNILISFEGDVKLTDFGIAKAATKATAHESGALRGKLLYMSPEQAWGKAMDRRSDIFSLGLVLYETLTGQRPFLGGSELSILEMVRECRIAPVESLDAGIPETLAAATMKALARDPDQRYAEAADMQADLERFLHEQRPPTGADLARFMRRLFEQEEAGETGPDEGPPAARTAGDAALAGAPEGDEASGKEGSSIQRFLRRFGIK